MAETKLILYDDLHERVDGEERYCELIPDSSGERLLMRIVDADRKPESFSDERFVRCVDEESSVCEEYFIEEKDKEPGIYVVRKTEIFQLSPDRKATDDRLRKEVIVGFLDEVEKIDSPLKNRLCEIRTELLDEKIDWEEADKQIDKFIMMECWYKLLQSDFRAERIEIDTQWRKRRPHIYGVFYKDIQEPETYIARRVFVAREYVGMSRRELADRCGVNLQQIEQLESGDFTWREGIDLLAMVGKALDTRFEITIHGGLLIN